MSRHRGSYQYEKKKRGRKALLILLAAFVILLAAAIGALFFAKGMINKMNQVDTEEEERIEPSAQDFEADESDEPDTLLPEEVVWTTTEDVLDDTDIKNILLIGQDRREGQGRQRSDTMIICSINKRTGRITMVSLMRDLYVPIPGYADNRLNAAYAFGGMSLLDETIEQDFGVHIDGNVEVDFEGFIEVMTRVGYLDISLTQEEADYINAKTVGESHLTAGVNSMNSQQVLTYARTRKIGNGDYERTERQRRVLRAAFNKMRECDLPTLYALAEDLLPCFTTDLSSSDIMGYIYNVVAGGMTLNDESYRLPADGTFTSERIRGMAVLVPDLEANSLILKQYLYGLK